MSSSGSDDDEDGPLTVETAGLKETAAVLKRCVATAHVKIRHFRKICLVFAK